MKKLKNNTIKKIKGLKPSLREKKRYVVYEIYCVSKKNIFSYEIAKKAIEDGLTVYLGIKGMSDVGIVFFSNYFSNNRGFIRVSTKSVNDVKAGFMFVKEISDIEVIIKPLFVTGLINKAKAIIENKT